MAVCSEAAPAFVVGLIALLGFATRVRGEMCYSKHSGFSSCSNGCCGPEDNQDCCSQIYLIVGLAIGAAAIGVVVVVLLMCWVCKDCQPKFCHCCGGERRRGERGRRERHDRRHGRHTGRRVLVHPVQPPDYSTATQERAPSVQPGLNHRNLPVSPPPPYTETTLSPPNPPQQGSPRAKLSAAAAPATASLLVAAHVTDSRHRQNTPEVIPRHSSDNDVNAFCNNTAVTAVSSSRDNENVVPSVHPPGPQNSRDPSDNSTNERSAFNRSLHNSANGRLAFTHSLDNSANNRLASSHTAARTTPRAGSSPREASVTNSPRGNSDHLIHVRETPRTARGSQNGVESSSAQVSSNGQDSAIGQPVLHTVRETVEDVDQLDLV